MWSLWLHRDLEQLLEFSRSMASEVGHDRARPEKNILVFALLALIVLAPLPYVCFSSAGGFRSWREPANDCFDSSRSSMQSHR